MIPGLIELALGAAYILGVGGASFLDVVKGWRAGLRESAATFPEGGHPRLSVLWHSTDWFGLGLTGMAVSCGPHHFHEGYHILFEHQPMTHIEFAALLFALPFGVAWLYFRAEALFGGSGDRQIDGRQAPMIAGLITIAVAMTLTVSISQRGAHWTAPLILQLTLAVLYCAVGYFLWSGQAYIYEQMGRWSAAGLSLAMVFPTCAVLHAAYGLNVSAGRYVTDPHFWAIDGLGIPMALWFLWMTYQLRHTERVPKVTLIEALKKAEGLV